MFAITFCFYFNNLFKVLPRSQCSIQSHVAHFAVTARTIHTDRVLMIVILCILTPVFFSLTFKQFSLYNTTWDRAYA